MARKWGGLQSASPAHAPRQGSDVAPSLLRHAVFQMSLAPLRTEMSVLKGFSHEAEAPSAGALPTQSTTTARSWGVSARPCGRTCRAGEGPSWRPPGKREAPQRGPEVPGSLAPPRPLSAALCQETPRENTETPKSPRQRPWVLKGTREGLTIPVSS